MSRHRNVRSMNYEDEYDGYDDVYGHSVEDDYCVSPSTAAQFIYDRNRHPELASFMEHNQIVEEDEEEASEEEALQDSTGFSRPKLPEMEEAQLNSCLEEIRNIIGDSTPEHVLVDAVLKSKFDFQRALSDILNQQEAPKPQREPRANTRRNRGAGQPGSIMPSKNLDSSINETSAASGNVIPVVQLDSAEENIHSAVARMTFTSGKQVQSGFTPEKKLESEIEADSGCVNGVKQELFVEDGAKGSASLVRTDRSPGRGDHGDSTPGRGVSPARIDHGNQTAATPSAKTSRSKHDKMDLKNEFEKRKAGGKDFINLVVIGHVDAGKSTLMGHVLFQLGFVNKRTMHKYEQESKKLGKASFAYAWVLDETEEERSRGVTMDVAQTRFETSTKVITLLDAPGHKDFIPNMITGAAQADVAVMVVNSTRGEFETGFETGGQTREHAMLIRSLGVFQLVVAVNKMDTVDWSQERYNEIVKKLGQFLKQAGFKESDVSYVPCSGLSGVNLTKPPPEPKLCDWYKGATLVDQIDKFKPPERPIDKPFRMCVSDVFKGMGSGFSISGTIQAGSVQVGERVLIMPQAETATVKGISIEELPVQFVFAGDNATLTVTGIDMSNVGVGSILCNLSNPILSTSRIQARVVIFNIEIPLTKGFPVVFHYQSLSEPANIKKLISQLHKSNGEVVKRKPRCLTKNMNAVLELEINRPICIELYKDFKDLGRFMLRYGGSTIAAGLVTKIMASQSSKNE